MDEKNPDNDARTGFRAMFDWLTGAASTRAAAAPPPVKAPEAALPARIGHYTIDRKLGQGGMGVVYAARDERLERWIAVKMLPGLETDEAARQRLWREARAAASVNHPNVCQIYEIGEEGGRLFIAMELLEGESLADRLGRGALSAAETIPIGLGILAALSALHARSIVHRDLKPSNVFLTAHGVKLLDFGLAQPQLAGAMDAASLTRTGIVMGTPRYMSPEQATGEPVDTRSDIFAVGALLFEMLAGRPAFAGSSLVDVLHATRYEQPPALVGSPTIAAMDRVIRRAVAKQPADRPASADAMAEELRTIRLVDSGSAGLAHALTRLVVLPFRVLRPDPETDFLAFSLPDAIATSLSGHRSLIVRSSAVAARFAGEAPDLKAIATEADVDRVVMGTLLRSGDQLRATAQLVDAPAGTLLTAHTVQTSLGDLFRLQDDIASRVSEALALPLSGASANTEARAARCTGLRALSARQRAGPHLRRPAGGAGPLREVARARPGLRTGVGASRPLPPRDWQVCRPDARERRARRGRLPPRVGAEPAPLDCAQVPTPTSRPTRASRARPCCGCWPRPPDTATIPSSSPGSCTPAATAGSSINPFAHTAKRADSIPTCPPASSRRCR